MIDNKSTSPITDLEQINALIIDSIQDIKGKQIVKMDLRGLDDSPTDYFIICSGESNTQMRAIASNVNLRLKQEAGWMPSSKEGQESDSWVLVDYFNTIVHIFHPEARKFYELEELWSDAEVTEYQDV